MTQINKSFSKLKKTKFSIKPAEVSRHYRYWQKLCNTFLPVSFEDSIWRFNRENRADEPLQGWKLHISVSILEACALFEKVAPILVSQDVQFKAPKTLEELSKINSGLYYGYELVGKFITIYPKDEEQAVKLAAEIHELTAEFKPISVPFDEQFRENSSVFYRYGAFSLMEMEDEEGRKISAFKNLSGKFVPDDRFCAVPEWLSDPFQNGNQKAEYSFDDTPLGTDYKIFRAVTQRGKGGTYWAVDFKGQNPRPCVVKEGRRNGEIGWNGQDGYLLVKNEFEVLKDLRKKFEAVPKVYESFEVFGNYYFTMEYVDGKSLSEIMKPRKRRFSIRQIIVLGIAIAEIIAKIHRAGWIWNDCKPANLIVTSAKKIRPIDFEAAYPINQNNPFDWQTKQFSKPNIQNGKTTDIYAFGAVLFFLLTGKFYDSKQKKAIKNFRRNVPTEIVEIIEDLLSGREINLSEIKIRLETCLS